MTFSIIKAWIKNNSNVLTSQGLILAPLVQSCVIIRIKSQSFNHKSSII